MLKKWLSHLEKRKHKKRESLHSIWEIEDSTAFLISLFDMISAKCQYGENMDALNYHERVFFVTQSLEAEVNNGGFEQFFANSSGDFANELEAAFVAIGACHTAEICKTALSVFHGEAPTNREERLARIELLSAGNYRRFLEACDEAFYRVPDNLNALNRAYIDQNREFFPDRKQA